VKIVNDTDADGDDDGRDTTVWQTARPIRPDCQNNEAAFVCRYIGTIYDVVARARPSAYRVINVKHDVHSYFILSPLYTTEALLLCHLFK